MLRRLRPVGDALYALGSDELGRDMLSRLIYGGRLSLAARIVESAVKDQFDHWLAGNPTQANRLLDWVVERADERIGTVRLGNGRITNYRLYENEGGISIPQYDPIYRFICYRRLQ